MEVVMELLRIPGIEKQALMALFPLDPARSVKIGTLGPEGTSSEHIARMMLRCIGDPEGCEITLEETFERCMDALVDGDIDLALVPHAYSKINAFYMHPGLRPVSVFHGSTPEYGLATRPDFAFDEEVLRTDTVVSHPAPVPMLEHHVAGPVKVATVTSTSQAAGRVADGHYNIALTNEQAVEQYNLRFVQRFSRIPMTWTVFSRKKDGHDHRCA
ncbi:bacilysin biosynthesis protein BacA [Streptomyces sp. JV178]|jgi:prephenate decarboxylase|uniref:bacilysin biosynthesis protein BacA n=2 Tax=unclassified Streptomyces TaxID=2593676 RepID=UPI000C1B02CF|nr:bacilysin biosynthesis protein BacA [Streptomyces sp. JV178]PIM66333.1 bacilysin biosynthesis protein BacA [Streptomyces sp. JV178]